VERTHVDHGGAVVVVGGTSGIGKAVARHYADRGREVVLTGRDPLRAKAVAEEVGGRARGIGLDLTEVEAIRPALADVGRVDHLVLTAVDRDENTVRDFDHGRALRLVTLKLVGYTEVVHALLDRMHEESSIVVFGGLAKDRPYPGSTTVSTVNGGVTGLVHTLAVELAPIRVNAIHPGIVGDTPYWSGKPDSVLEAIRSRVPLRRLVRTEDVVDAVAFLLENRSMNGADLVIDGGWLLL
jgi:NAD(P)-dependent dehydrogenase (short-subunit alcohol dehydrogenase family)